MFLFPPTIILRHRRENLKKCSLRGLETRADCLFFTYPKCELPDLSNYFLLALDAPPLSLTDKEKGIFLIDGTWRYAELMERQLAKPHLFERRSLPQGVQTAYPRRQEDCPDPGRGLASVEALFVAYALLGRSTEGLLDHFHWSKDFLNKNASLDFLRFYK
jgi:pre-rRNA-processing protein TSR3